MALLAATALATILAAQQASAQTTRTLDGTSGSNSISTSYTTDGGLTLNLGFYADYLIVGGGGGGGNGGGGGGGGGFLSVAAVQFNAASYGLTVGDGGVASSGGVGGTGGDSIFNSGTANGGGGGGGLGSVGTNGGSGGGGGGREGDAGAATQPSPGFGNNGGAGGSGFAGGDLGGGGGGGAGSAGTAGTVNSAGNGGDGLASTITGASVTYAGGGGGGRGNRAGGGAVGGTGGGGNGGWFTNNAAVDGANGLGGGGGGGGGGVDGITYDGARGGSGVVIVRYAGEAIAGVGGSNTSFVGNGTIGENGLTYQVQTFTSSGTFNLSSVDFSARLGATLNGTLSGNGGITYAGPGLLALAADNSYLGTTTISSGTLQVGSGGTAGTLGAGAVTNDAALVINRSNTMTVANAISGGGSLTQQGAGTTVLTGNNTYSGATAITAGRLQVGNGGSGGTLGGSGSIANEGVLAFNRSGVVTLDRAVTGAGSLVQQGPGTTILTATNTYSGSTTISGGRLVVNGSLGNTAVTVASGAALGGSGTIAGTISGAGTVAPGNSPGILTAAAVDPSAGTKFVFEFSGTAPNYGNASESVNDVLRLTDPTAPFTSALTAANTKTLFLNFTKNELLLGAEGAITELTGGFFTDLASDFTSLLNNETSNNAGFQVYVLGDGGGTDNRLNGVGYYNWRNPAMFGWDQSLFLSTVPQTADFGSGNVSGQVMLLTVAVPEPSTFALGAAGLASAAWLRHRRRACRAAGLTAV